MSKNENENVEKPVEVVETKVEAAEEKATIDWKGIGKKALNIGKVAIVAAVAFVAGGAVAASKSIDENSRKEDVIEGNEDIYEE